VWELVKWPFSNWGHQNAAGRYIIFSIVLLVITNIACYTLVGFAPRLHRASGKIYDGERLSACFTLLSSLTMPGLGMTFIALTVGGWKKMKSRVVYKWQAIVISSVLLAICIAAIGLLLNTIIWETYALEGGEFFAADPEPYYLKFSWQVQTIFSWINMALVAVLSLSLFQVAGADEGGDE
jgi:hypothetical protein